MKTRFCSTIFFGLPAGMAVALLLAFFFMLQGSVVAAPGAPNAPTTVIGFEDFDGGAINLSSSTNVFDFEAGGGSGEDVFGRVDGQLGGTGMPNDMADDTVVDVSGARTGSANPSDQLGIAGQNATAFFGMNDMDAVTVNNATWTFDISSAISVTDIQIDIGAMGDFEASSSDGFTIEARIDSDAFQTIFQATPDEDANKTYRALDDGNNYSLTDPLQLFIDGSGTPVGYLDKSDPATGNFDTYTSTLLTGESGSTLDIRVSWSGTPSGSEPMGIDNITINGVAAPNIGDLSVSKTSPSTTIAGKNLVYEITIENQNLDPATGVVLTDTLPISTTYVSDNSGVTPTHPSQREYVWDLSSIISGTQMTFNLTVTVDASVTSGTRLTNTVTVTTTAIDENPANNLDEVQTTVVPNPSCGSPATRIHIIQGNGDVSPEEGNIHAIEGVVVGDFQTSASLWGFFVQEDDAKVDADPTTSEGIFVYDGSSPTVDVNEGDVVRVVGKVEEYNGLTQLFNVSSVEICPTSGVASAATPTMPVASEDDWEWVEGMLVNFSQTLYVTEHYFLGRYGEISLSVNDRLFNPTQVITPGLAAHNLQDLNNRSRIQLNDAMTDKNPDPIIYPSLELSAINTLRGGDKIPDLTGVMSYAFGAYKIEPVGTVTFTHSNPRPTAPDSVDGSLQVASFNVLNYFSTIDTGADICGPNADQGCRGADSASEFTRQRDKIINAILTMDADIVGLMEIENHATDAAVDNLVDGLNAIAGTGTYTKVVTGPIGEDVIKVALIYQPASATPVGNYAVLDDGFDPNYHDDYNRPALAQTFSDTNGGRVTVIVNHLKSKSSDCDALGDPDTGDGQGNCNLTRTAAAEIMLEWLQTDPTGSGSPNFLIVGDLNSYAMEDPIKTLEDGGFTDLYRASGGDNYAYVYGGQWGTLDYSMASAALLPDVTGATAWHINADEPKVLDYNEEYKSTYQLTSLYAPDEYRASDHDPIIVGLDLSFEVPDASFTSNNPVTIGEVSVFTNTSTGTAPLTYLWDFGDSITSTLESPTHIYEQFGTYTVTLTVENVYGTDVFTGTYTVDPFTIYLPIIFTNND